MVFERREIVIVIDPIFFFLIVIEPIFHVLFPH